MTPTSPKTAKNKFTIRRVFSTAGINPYNQVKWELRSAQLTNAKGEVIFEQKEVEVPVTWSQTATNIVASKYFYGKTGTKEREHSVRDLVHRVASTITEYGRSHGYFHDAGESDIFHDELVVLLLTQRGAFNSPVWFNVGLDLYEPDAQSSHFSWSDSDKQVAYRNTGYHTPQCSACFINAVEDSMEGIMELAKTEAMLFKFGSGTGTNFSSLRSSKEFVSGGGMASGPLSFMKGLDAFAGVIKSGGKTRRAAKMAILNADHPDIEEFIDCKLNEEKKAQTLMQGGYDGSSGPDSEAYSSIFFQNANNSVRVTDEFMDAVENDGDWDLVEVKNPQHAVATVKAKKLFRKIAEATWHCGDPGMQYDTTINQWHTSKQTAQINASNPCSEYMFLDNSACNLASINLLKFLRKNNSFDFQEFEQAVDIFILAQEILVDLSGYPTLKIAKNSHDFRPLGLGYANLGAMLMALGIPYDSDSGRAYAACLTSIMTGEAYRMSAALAARLPQMQAANEGLKTTEEGLSGACPGWFENRDSFLDVIEMHLDASKAIPHDKEVAMELRQEAERVWVEALEMGKNYGYRNSQVTVLAPTGTIGFLMDCDTTGIEPELGLVKYKKLVGGGLMKLVNDTVSRALGKLGYKGELADSILKFIDENGTVEGSDLADSHLPVFDTSFRPAKGTRSIHYMGHIKMMAAVQPFLSGAISKTVNLPEEATIEEIEKAYFESWKLGLKAVAIYRDGSKKNQVLVTSKEEKTVVQVEPEDFNAPPKAIRHRLPDDRNAIIHKFSIANHEGYLTVGTYPNGQPGEIFITMAKEGSTISGLMDGFALMFSIALQHGVPLQSIVDKLAHTRFEPSGWSKQPDIGYAKSILDYIARYLDNKFLKQPLLPFTPQYPVTEQAPMLPASASSGINSIMDLGDSPSCPECGSITVRNGSCYRCLDCGSTTGCS